ncbi:MAG TPA: glutathione peroxidase [Polyangiaceae bacterium]|nr:glutathione peroxidase [Polyangiaceae bacterium]
MTSFHDFEMKTITGERKALGDFSGKAVLVVNVASRCGLTPQYTALEALHRKYAAKGFSVVGFPCNQFAGQEPGTEAEIQTFCSTKYDVTFPLFAKVDVNGEGTSPLYAFLKSEQAPPKGPGDVTWNFEKFLVSKTGQVVGRFDPSTTPDDPALVAAVERALG